jgi:hypothetical protein
MNKIILILTLFVLTSFIKSQSLEQRFIASALKSDVIVTDIHYNIAADSTESINFRLLKSDGTPYTGQSANITLKTLKGEVVVTTVNEIGTQGNYNVVFTDNTVHWALMKLYVSGVYQQFFGVKRMGNPFNDFFGLTVNNTITGDNTFSGIMHVSAIDCGNTTAIYNLSDPANPYEPVTLHYLLNVYNDTGYMPLWYSTNYGNYFNTGDFTLSGGKIHLAYTVGDSMAASEFTTHYGFYVGEGLYYKNLTLKRPLPDPDYIYQWKYYYTNTYSSAKDSFYVINKDTVLGEGQPLTVILVGSYQPVTTVTLPFHAKWKVTIYYDYEFSYGQSIGNVEDSIRLIVVGSGSLVTDTLCHRTYKVVYPSSVYAGYSGSGEISFISPVAETYYQLQGLCSSDAGTINRKINYFKIEAILLN